MKGFIMVALLAFIVDFCLAVEPRVGIGDLDPTLLAEIKSLKTTLGSVQGSLITSVGLIQDQLEQFGKQLTIQVDSRLSKMEEKLEKFSATINKVDERSAGWDQIQHHVRSWGDQMISLDTKVDHLGRSQMDRLTTITGQVNSLQSSLSHNMESIGEQITALEARLHRSLSDPNPEVIASLQRIESKLASSRVRSRYPHIQQQQAHANSRGLCNEMKLDFEKLASKIDSALSKSPRYIATEAGGAPITTSEDSDFEIALTGFETELEEQLVKLFRKVSLPFKKANRRLRDMEDIGRQLESTMGEIRTSVQLASADIDRKFSDFFNMTLEMFDHQHHQIEMSERTLAGIKLCCSGTASDLSDFKAKTESALEKLESKQCTDLNPRSSAQLRFDSDRILSAIKEQKSLIIDGFDNCHDQKPMTSTTASTTTSTEASTKASTVTATSTEINVGLISGLPEPMGNAEKMLQTCEQLLEAGFLDSKVYTVDTTVDAEDNANERDFRQRYCDQTTAGGGWTVIQRRGGAEEEPRINFTRSWNDYKHGFGDLYGDFWFGNDFIHKLTNDPLTTPVALRIELQNFEGVEVIAEYSDFRVDSEEANYRLWISGYSGNATDSFSAHNGSEFSTIDRINDRAPKCCPCAPAYGGGWWFYSCFESNLNGEYHENPTDNDYYRGIIWELWSGDYSLKSAKMMTRSRAFNAMQLSDP